MICDGTWNRFLSRLPVSALVVSLVVGCGEEPEPRNPNFSQPESNYVTDPDVTDSDADEENRASNDGKSETDVDTSEPTECLQGALLGELEPGAQGTHRLNFDAIDNGDITCVATDAEEVLRSSLEFSTPTASLVRWTYITEVAPTDIGSTTTSEDCSKLDGARCVTGRSVEFFYSGEDTHLLHTEMVDPMSSTNLHFEVDAAECDEPGGGWCADGHYQHCYQGRRVDAYPCAGAGCDDDGRCAADRCETALPVAPGSPSDPTIVEGHRKGYTHTGHFQDRHDCGLSTIAEESLELFLAVDDLPADKDLVIESQGQGTYGFFLISDCDADNCLEVGSADEEFENRLRWSPDSDVDDLVIAIRPSDPVSRAFSFALYFTAAESMD